MYELPGISGNNKQLLHTVYRPAMKSVLE